MTTIVACAYMYLRVPGPACAALKSQPEVGTSIGVSRATFNSTRRTHARLVALLKERPRRHRLALPCVQLHPRYFVNLRHGLTHQKLGARSTYRHEQTISRLPSPSVDPRALGLEHSTDLDTHMPFPVVVRHFGRKLSAVDRGEAHLLPPTGTPEGSATTSGQRRTTPQVDPLLTGDEVGFRDFELAVSVAAAEGCRLARFPHNLPR
ncbi:hypothetical protein MN608_07888 [Microdochium nivale]|nr:hypothetical protein MN608_07888 [Microdochium nivale]